jgi:AcrR family transcriptional regulator
MGTAKRKEREKELRRAAILEAAEQIILEKGYENLNMDEVAEKSELSKGTLYLYFNSKTELIVGIVHKAMSILDAKIAEVITRDLKGIEIIHQIAKEYLHFAEQHPEYYSAMQFYENLNGSSELAGSEYLNSCSDYLRRTFSYTVRAIQTGMQDGTIRSDYDPKELALLLWSVSKGIVHMSYQKKRNPQLRFLDELGLQSDGLSDIFIRFMANGIASNEKNAD